MKIIGFWDSSLIPNLNHLTVGDVDQFIVSEPPYKESLKAKVINYLDSAMSFSSFRGASINPINGKEEIWGGYSVKSDGKMGMDRRGSILSC